MQSRQQRHQAAIEEQHDKAVHQRPRSHDLSRLGQRQLRLHGFAAVLADRTGQHLQ